LARANEKEKALGEDMAPTYMGTEIRWMKGDSSFKLGEEGFTSEKT